MWMYLEEMRRGWVFAKGFGRLKARIVSRNGRFAAIMTAIAEK